MGSQFLESKVQFASTEIDLYFPVFTFLQFFFYMGWLKVKQKPINLITRGQTESDNIKRTITFPGY